MAVFQTGGRNQAPEAIGDSRGKGEKSRDQILKASLKVFLRKGYRGTSLAELCKVTGFTKGALYHHFQDKDDIYRQSLDAFFQFSGPPAWIKGEFPELKERIRQGFLEVDKSREWIQKQVGSKKDSAILSFYTFLYEATRRFPEYQATLDQYDDEKHQQLALAFRKAQERGEIRSDLDPWPLALELDALLQQLVYLRFVNHRVKEGENILLVLFENYWKRLLPTNRAAGGES